MVNLLKISFLAEWSQVKFCEIHLVSGTVPAQNNINVK